MSQEPPLTPVLRELRDLFMNSGGWRQLPGTPDLQVFMHTFSDGTVDVLTVRGETDAEVERTNPDGALVKSKAGTLPEMTPPDSPDAPTPLVQTRHKPFDMDRPPWMW